MKVWRTRRQDHLRWNFVADIKNGDAVKTQCQLDKKRVPDDPSKDKIDGSGRLAPVLDSFCVSLEA